MSFAAPLVLVALVAVPVLALGYVAEESRRRAGAAAFAKPALQASVAPRRPGWRRHLPMLAILLAIVLLIIAVAKPQRTVFDGIAKPMPTLPLPPPPVAICEFTPIT